MDGMDMQTYLQTNGHDNNNQVSVENGHDNNNQANV